MKCMGPIKFHFLHTENHAEKPCFQGGGNIPEEEEVEVSSRYPIRVIEVRYGINEDGGGFVVYVRLDDVEPEKVFDIAVKLLKRVNGKSEGEIYERDPKEYV